MQENLFSPEETIVLPGGGEITVFRGWLPSSEAFELRDEFLGTITWEQPEIKIAGQLKKIPRKQAWYGGLGAGFKYSGVYFEPLPFPSIIKELKQKIELSCETEFNSVLVNLYRSQSDSVGWHADDEPEFGESPKIASLSLGGSRRFQLKPKVHHYKSASWVKRRRAISIELQNGDLLLMGPNVQENWLHAVPKEDRFCDLRINLTFRLVIGTSET